MFNIKINPKIFILVIAVILLFLLMGYVVMNQFNVLNEVKTDLENKKVQYIKSKNLLEKLYDTKDSVVSMEDKLIYINKLIPQNPNETQLLNDIYNLPPSFDGIISDIAFEKNVEKDLVNEQPVNFVFEGSYVDLIGLMDNLEQKERIIRIDKLRIREGSEGVPQIRAVVYVTAFYK